MKKLTGHFLSKKIKTPFSKRHFYNSVSSPHDSDKEFDIDSDNMSDFDGLRDSYDNSTSSNRTSSSDSSTDSDSEFTDSGEMSADSIPEVANGSAQG